MNLSNRQLTPHETSVLAKGETFAVTPKTVPVEEIVASVEAGIRGLPRDQADEIRLEASRALRLSLIHI